MSESSITSAASASSPDIPHDIQVEKDVLHLLIQQRSPDAILTLQEVEAYRDCKWPTLQQYASESTQSQPFTPLPRAPVWTSQSMYFVTSESNTSSPTASTPSSESVGSKSFSTVTSSTGPIGEDPFSDASKVGYGLNYIEVEVIATPLPAPPPRGSPTILPYTHSLKESRLRLLQSAAARFVRHPAEAAREMEDAPLLKQLYGEQKDVIETDIIADGIRDQLLPESKAAAEAKRPNMWSQRTDDISFLYPRFAQAVREESDVVFQADIEMAKRVWNKWQPIFHSSAAATTADDPFQELKRRLESCEPIRRVDAERVGGTIELCSILAWYAADPRHATANRAHALSCLFQLLVTPWAVTSPIAMEQLFTGPDPAALMDNPIFISKYDSDKFYVRMCQDHRDHKHRNLLILNTVAKLSPEIRGAIRAMLLHSVLSITTRSMQTDLVRIMIILILADDFGLSWSSNLQLLAYQLCKDSQSIASLVVEFEDMDFKVRGEKEKDAEAEEKEENKQPNTSGAEEVKQPEEKKGEGQDETPSEETKPASPAAPVDESYLPVPYLCFQILHTMKKRAFFHTVETGKSAYLLQETVLNFSLFSRMWLPEEDYNLFLVLIRSHSFSSNSPIVVYAVQGLIDLFERRAALSKRDYENAVQMAGRPMFKGVYANETASVLPTCSELCKLIHPFVQEYVLRLIAMDEGTQQQMQEYNQLSLDKKQRVPRKKKEEEQSLLSYVCNRLRDVFQDIYNFHTPSPFGDTNSANKLWDAKTMKLPLEDIMPQLLQFFKQHVWFPTTHNEAVGSCPADVKVAEYVNVWNESSRSIEQDKPNTSQYNYVRSWNAVYTSWLDMLKTTWSLYHDKQIRDFNKPSPPSPFHVLLYQEIDKMLDDMSVPHAEYQFNPEKKMHLVHYLRPFDIHASLDFDQAQQYQLFFIVEQGNVAQQAAAAVAMAESRQMLLRLYFCHNTAYSISTFLLNSTNRHDFIMSEEQKCQAMRGELSRVTADLGVADVLTQLITSYATPPSDSVLYSFVSLMLSYMETSNTCVRTRSFDQLANRELEAVPAWVWEGNLDRMMALAEADVWRVNFEQEQEEAEKAQAAKEQPTNSDTSSASSSSSSTTFNSFGSSIGFGSSNPPQSGFNLGAPATPFGNGNGNSTSSLVGGGTGFGMSPFSNFGQPNPTFGSFGAPTGFSKPRRELKPKFVQLFVRILTQEAKTTSKQQQPALNPKLIEPYIPRLIQLALTCPDEQVLISLLKSPLTARFLFTDPRAMEKVTELCFTEASRAIYEESHKQLERLLTDLEEKAAEADEKKREKREKAASNQSEDEQEEEEKDDGEDDEDDEDGEGSEEDDGEDGEEEEDGDENEDEETSANAPNQNENAYDMDGFEDDDSDEDDDRPKLRAGLESFENAELIVQCYDREYAATLPAVLKLSSNTTQLIKRCVDSVTDSIVFFFRWALAHETKIMYAHLNYGNYETAFKYRDAHRDMAMHFAEYILNASPEAVSMESWPEKLTPLLRKYLKKFSPRHFPDDVRNIVFMVIYMFSLHPMLCRTLVWPNLDIILPILLTATFVIEEIDHVSSEEYGPNELFNLSMQSLTQIHRQFKQQTLIDQSPEVIASQFDVEKAFTQLLTMLADTIVTPQVRFNEVEVLQQRYQAACDAPDTNFHEWFSGHMALAQAFLVFHSTCKAEFAPLVEKAQVFTLFYLHLAFVRVPNMSAEESQKGSDEVVKFLRRIRAPALHLELLRSYGRWITDNSKAHPAMIKQLQSQPRCVQMIHSITKKMNSVYSDVIPMWKEMCALMPITVELNSPSVKEEIEAQEKEKEKKKIKEASPFTQKPDYDKTDADKEEEAAKEEAEKLTSNQTKLQKCLQAMQRRRESARAYLQTVSSRLADIDGNISSPDVELIQALDALLQPLAKPASNAYANLHAHGFNLAEFALKFKVSFVTPILQPIMDRFSEKFSLARLVKIVLIMARSSAGLECAQKSNLPNQVQTSLPTLLHVLIMVLAIPSRQDSEMNYGKSLPKFPVTPVDMSLCLEVLHLTLLALTHHTSYPVSVANLFAELFVTQISNPVAHSYFVPWASHYISDTPIADISLQDADKCVTYCVPWDPTLHKKEKAPVASSKAGGSRLTSKVKKPSASSSTAAEEEWVLSPLLIRFRILTTFMKLDQRTIDVDEKIAGDCLFELVNYFSSGIKPRLKEVDVAAANPTPASSSSTLPPGVAWFRDAFCQIASSDDVSLNRDAEVVAPAFIENLFKVLRIQTCVKQFGAANNYPYDEELASTVHPSFIFDFHTLDLFLYHTGSYNWADGAYDPPLKCRKEFRQFLSCYFQELLQRNRVEMVYDAVNVMEASPKPFKELPKQVVHPVHSFHTLTLKKKVYDGTFSCDDCDSQGTGPVYHCDKCDTVDCCLECVGHGWQLQFRILSYIIEHIFVQMNVSNANFVDSAMDLKPIFAQVNEFFILVKEDDLTKQMLAAAKVSANQPTKYKHFNPAKPWILPIDTSVGSITRIEGHDPEHMFLYREKYGFTCAKCSEEHKEKSCYKCFICNESICLPCLKWTSESRFLTDDFVEKVWPLQLADFKAPATTDQPQHSEQEFIENFPFPVLDDEAVEQCLLYPFTINTFPEIIERLGEAMGKVEPSHPAFKEMVQTVRDMIEQNMVPDSSSSSSSNTGPSSVPRWQRLLGLISFVIPLLKVRYDGRGFHDGGKLSTFAVALAPFIVPIFVAALKSEMLHVRLLAATFLFNATATDYRNSSQLLVSAAGDKASAQLMECTIWNAYSPNRQLKQTYNAHQLQHRNFASLLLCHLNRSQPIETSEGFRQVFGHLEFLSRSIRTIPVVIAFFDKLQREGVRDFQSFATGVYRFVNPMMQVLEDPTEAKEPESELRIVRKKAVAQLKDIYQSQYKFLDRIIACAPMNEADCSQYGAAALKPAVIDTLFDLFTAEANWAVTFIQFNLLFDSDELVHVIGVLIRTLPWLHLHVCNPYNQVPEHVTTDTCLGATNALFQLIVKDVTRPFVQKRIIQPNIKALTAALTLHAFSQSVHFGSLPFTPNTYSYWDSASGTENIVTKIAGSSHVTFRPSVRELPDAEHMSVFQHLMSHPEFYDSHQDQLRLDDYESKEFKDIPAPATSSDSSLSTSTENNASRTGSTAELSTAADASENKSSDEVKSDAPAPISSDSSSSQPADSLQPTETAAETKPDKVPALTRTISSITAGKSKFVLDNRRLSTARLTAGQRVALDAIYQYLTTGFEIRAPSSSSSSKEEENNSAKESNNGVPPPIMDTMIVTHDASSLLLQLLSSPTLREIILKEVGDELLSAISTILMPFTEWLSNQHPRCAETAPKDRVGLFYLGFAPSVLPKGVSLALIPVLTGLWVESQTHLYRADPQLKQKGSGPRLNLIWQTFALACSAPSFAEFPIEISRAILNSTMHSLYMLNDDAGTELRGEVQPLLPPNQYQQWQNPSVSSEPANVTHRAAAPHSLLVPSLFSLLTLVETALQRHPILFPTTNLRVQTYLRQYQALHSHFHVQNWPTSDVEQYWKEWEPITFVARWVRSQIIQRLNLSQEDIKVLTETYPSTVTRLVLQMAQQP